MSCVRVATAVLLLAVALLSAADPELTRTPFGWLPSDCVHQLDLGSKVHSDDHGRSVITPIDGQQRAAPSCPHDLSQYVRLQGGPSQRTARQPDVGHGWQAYTSFDYTPVGGISSFVGNFSVPDLPPDPERGQILYIFTGLQNINWIPEPNAPLPTQPFDIIQPVLQFPGDHGNYWSVKSWYVTILSGAFASSEVKVPAGDVIFGNMTQTGPKTWFIESYSYAAKQSTNATVTHNRLASQPWAYCTLEVYDVNQCSQYPDNDIKFTGMSMLDAGGNPITAKWDAIEGSELACGEKAQVLSPADVDIAFQKQ